MVASTRMLPPPDLQVGFFQFQSLHHHLIDINIDVIIIDVIIIDVNIKVVVAINDDHDFCRKEKERWVICWPT